MRLFCAQSRDEIYSGLCPAICYLKSRIKAWDCGKQCLSSVIWHVSSEGAQQELICVTAERDRLKREKEEEVASLNGKLHTMEKSYEAILQDALDALATKIEVARTKWDSESQLVEQRTQQVLLEFGQGLQPTISR